MVSLNTVRTVSIRYQSDGAEKMRADADSVAASQTRMGQAAQQAATVTEAASKRMLSATSAYERTRAQIDATFRAQQQIEKADRNIDRAVRQGVIDEAQAAYDRASARSRYTPNLNDNDPSRRGLRADVRQNLVAQGLDVGTSIAGGMPLGLIAAQQGPQIYQALSGGEGGLKGGLKALGESALGLVTPFTVAATAVAGLTVATGAAASAAARDQAQMDQATKGLGAMTGATASQLNALALANAEAGKVSASTARDLVAGYASTGQIALPVIADLTRATSDYARITGQDVSAAAAELSRFFAEPAAGADDLARRMGGLSDATSQLIARQVEQGDQSAAQQSLADALKASIDANAAATTGWAAAWDKAAAAASGYWEAAKRIAGIKLGVAPEGAQEAFTRLDDQINKANRLRQALGQEPLGIGSDLIRQRDTARIIADTEAREAASKAAEEAASKASREAGVIARAVDPLGSQYRDLTKKRNELRSALDNPLTRSKLDDPSQVEDAARAYDRAITTMTGADGRMISSAERARQADQLRADAIKASTDAQKAAVAERQKAFDLAGKVLSPLDAGGQITRAGQLSTFESAAKAASKGGGEKLDEYDRAVTQIENRIRRQEQEAQTFGMGAEAAARYRTETDLLTAAKRAERDITPALTAQIQSYAAQAGDVAAAQERLRDAMRSADEWRGVGRDTIGSLARDLGRGTSAADAMSSALSRLSDRLVDLAATSVTDSLFGKRGSSDFGLLGGAFGSSGAGGGGLGGFLGSIFGFGGASAGSPTGGVRLFADGGFTGSGGRYEPAGVVHRGEYVFDAFATSRIGVGALEAIRRGMPGYAEGGLVGRSAAFAGMVGAANANAAPVFQTIVQNNAPVNAETREVPDGRGGRRQEIVINEMVASGLKSPQAQQALQQRRVIVR